MDYLLIILSIQATVFCIGWKCMMVLFTLTDEWFA